MEHTFYFSPIAKDYCQYFVFLCLLLRKCLATEIHEGNMSHPTQRAYSWSATYYNMIHIKTSYNTLENTKIINTFLKTQIHPKKSLWKIFPLLLICYVQLLIIFKTLWLTFITLRYYTSSIQSTWKRWDCELHWQTCEWPIDCGLANKF